MTDTAAPVVDWRTDPNRECLLCGVTRREIKHARGDLSCGTTDSYTGEPDAEFLRHRFKPWTPKELDARRQQNQRVAQELGDMAAWWQQEGRHADD